MTLQSDLDGFRAAWEQRVGPEIASRIAADNAALAASGALGAALGAGDALPRLTLPDALGTPFDLGRAADAGPLVVTFYRGGWCPYCSLELRAWQQALPRLRAAGAQLVAVSPEAPDNALSTAEKNDLAFPVLSDTDGRLADAFGICFQLSEAIIALYREFGHDLPAHNAGTGWTLPVPASFVAGRGGRILLAHVEADYRRRLDPAAALAALAGQLAA
jgi:peroxiredoxin